MFVRGNKGQMHLIKTFLILIVLLHSTKSSSQMQPSSSTSTPEILMINFMGGYVELDYPLNEYYIKCFKGQFFTPMYKSTLWLGAQYTLMFSRDFFRENQRYFLLGPALRYCNVLNKERKYFLNIDGSINYGSIYLDKDEFLQVKEGFLLGYGMSFEWKLNAHFSLIGGGHLYAQTLKGGGGVFGFPFLGLSLR